MKLMRSEVEFVIQQLSYQNDGLTSIINECEYYLDEEREIAEMTQAQRTITACDETVAKNIDLINKFTKGLK
jgi:hypothetical protein